MRLHLNQNLCRLFSVLFLLFLWSSLIDLALLLKYETNSGRERKRKNKKEREKTELKAREKTIRENEREEDKELHF